MITVMAHVRAATTEVRAEDHGWLALRDADGSCLSLHFESVAAVDSAVAALAELRTAVESDR